MNLVSSNIQFRMQFSEISRFAEELAQRYNPEGLSPFPYEYILRDKPEVEIYILAVEDSGISGAISFDKEHSKFKIIINQDKAPTRRHFTIAHELGHYFLHQDTIKQEE